MTYYNEHDPKAAAWLRELIKEGHIPAGDVDTRDIQDIKPHELTRYTQQHFFAGIGGWALALRLADWPDDRAVRTGSRPCQPFSAAGAQLAEKDARHLWPVFRDLIAFGEATVTFGEQVASALGREWLAGVRADLEAMAYEVGAADLCSAGVASPHIRQRLFWVAYAMQQRRGKGSGQYRGIEGARGRQSESAEHRDVGRLANTDGGITGDGNLQRGRQHGQRPENGGAGGMEHANGERREGERLHVRSRGPLENPAEAAGRSEAGGLGHADEPGSQGWGERLVECPYQWPPGTPNLAVLCTDGKARRIEPGSFPLAHGIPVRVGLLRGYGNAINPWLAAEFILACEEALT